MLIARASRYTGEAFVTPAIEKKQAKR